MKKVFIGLLTLIIIGEALATGFLPITKGHLFELFTQKSGPIYFIIFMFFFNYFCIEACQCVKNYLVTRISLLFRKDRTLEVISKISPKKINVSNIKQRIQEDIKLSYQNRFGVWTEYVISTLILIQLLYLNIQYPILIGCALAFAVVSIIIAVQFNSPLTWYEFEVQSAEANFRNSAINKKTGPGELLWTNFRCKQAITIKTWYLLFTKLQLGIVAVLPYIILTPILLSGKITLGELVTHQSTFTLIVVNASVLIQLYPILIQGTASEKRVKELEENL